MHEIMYWESESRCPVGLERAGSFVPYLMVIYFKVVRLLGQATLL